MLPGLTVVTSLVCYITLAILGWNNNNPNTNININDGKSRYAYHPLAVSPSAVQSPISWFKPKALSGGAVVDTIRDYANSAVMAREAGYDGVEVRPWLLLSLALALPHWRPPNSCMALTSTGPVVVHRSWARKGT